MRSRAWAKTPSANKASKFSLTAFTLPGRVMMIVFLIVPATGRDKAANGVRFREEDRMRCTKPGASRSNSDEITLKMNEYSQRYEVVLSPDLWCPITNTKSGPTSCDKEINDAIIAPASHHTANFAFFIWYNFILRALKAMSSEDRLDRRSGFVSCIVL